MEWTWPGSSFKWACSIPSPKVTYGSTRARRYANHTSGRKYDIAGKEKGKKVVLPRTNPKDAASLVKAEAAEVFRGVLERVKDDEKYLRLAERHREVYESQPLPEDISQFEENTDVK